MALVNTAHADTDRPSASGVPAYQPSQMWLASSQFDITAPDQGPQKLSWPVPQSTQPGAPRFAMRTMSSPPAVETKKLEFGAVGGMSETLSGPSPPTM